MRVVSEEHVPNESLERRSLSMKMRQSVREFSVEPPLFMIDSVVPRGLIAAG